MIYVLCIYILKFDFDIYDWLRGLGCDVGEVPAGNGVAFLSSIKHELRSLPYETNVTALGTTRHFYILNYQRIGKKQTCTYIRIHTRGACYAVALLPTRIGAGWCGRRERV